MSHLSHVKQMYSQSIHLGRTRLSISSRVCHSIKSWGVIMLIRPNAGKDFLTISSWKRSRWNFELGFLDSNRKLKPSHHPILRNQIPRDADVVTNPGNRVTSRQEYSRKSNWDKIFVSRNFRTDRLRIDRQRRTKRKLGL